MIDLNKSTKSELYIVILLVIFIQLVLGFQGFDVCDDGFVLTFYQQIFNNPSSVEYNFLYWLSGVVGGLWYELFPKGGILWFRVFTVLINTLCFITAYNIFKRFIPKRIVFLGLIIVLFVNDYGFLVYYHNHITVLLTLLSVLYLMKGIGQNRNLFLIISGFLIAINVFARIPNITLFVFIFAIPFSYYLRKENYRKAIKPMVHYALGIVLGFVFILLLLVALGQLEIMQKAIYSLFDLGKAEDSTHNVIGLLKTHRYHYTVLFGVTSQLIVLMFIFLIGYKYIKKQVFKIIFFVIGFCVAFLWLKKGDIYPIYAIAFLGVFLVLFTKSIANNIKTLAFVGLLMLVFLPLGSGGGIHSSGYMCIWLSVPFFFYWFYNLGNIKASIKNVFLGSNFTIPKKAFKTLVLFIGLSFLSAKAYNMSKEAYFDKGSRIEKTYVIENELAKGIYTTQRRSQIINELLLNIKPYVKSDDYLLAYDKIPMIHFLTETKPYMYNPWVWIYDSNSFERKLDQAEKEISTYPIVVQQKFETIRAFSEPIPDYMSEAFDNEKGLINAYDANKNKTMNAFLKRNEYKIVWSNSYFNIYQTTKKHK